MNEERAADKLSVCSEESQEASDGETSSESEWNPSEVSGTGECDTDLDDGMVFNFEPLNVRVQVGNQQFWVHEYKLLAFGGLKPAVHKAKITKYGWKEVKLDDDVSDFRNMLQVLYSTQFEPQTFDASILKSTLRLAAKYQYPALRAYAIEQLGQHFLDPIERFALARDGDVTEWMSRAIDELTHRVEPITGSEARILGYDKVAEVAALREDAVYQRGLRAGAGTQSSDTPPTSHHAVLAPSLKASSSVIELASTAPNFSEKAEDIEKSSTSSKFSFTFTSPVDSPPWRAPKL